MSLGLSKEEMEKKVLTDLEQPIAGYAAVFSKVQMEITAKVIANVLAENNSKIEDDLHWVGIDI